MSEQTVQPHFGYRASVAIVLSLFGTFAIIKLSAIHIAQHWFPSSLEQHFTLIFEKDAWQFALAFLCSVVLSRGHLWSYGIRSDNLKHSMSFLAGVYGFTILFFLALRLLNIPFSADNVAMHLKNQNSILVLLIQWMSSPVADQILFFSLVQSVLMKNNVSKISLGGIPLHLDIIIAALFFAYFRSGIPLTEIPVLNIIMDCVIGIFSGYVYSKTTSVLTPMLGQAFFYGFPFFMKLLNL